MALLDDIMAGDKSRGCGRQLRLASLGVNGKLLLSLSVTGKHCHGVCFPVQHKWGVCLSVNGKIKFSWDGQVVLLFDVVLHVKQFYLHLLCVQLF